MNTAIFIITIGFIAIAIVFILKPDLAPLPEPSVNNQPEFFMYDFVQLNTDAITGQVKQKLKAEKIDIYNENYSLLKSPEITINKKDGFKIKINAENAQKFEQNKFLLSGGVKITNNLLSSVETLKTPQLWVYPDQNLAATDKKVELKRSDSITTGTGARFQIDLNKIELLSDAITIYNIESNN